MILKKEDVLRVAFLVESNNHLSASRAGLEARTINRKAALLELLFMLELTKEEFEEQYYKWAESAID